MKILLVAYDDDSYAHRFPQGLGYIAAALIKEGHEVVIYNQDKYHYPDQHLTGYLDENKFDIVGLGIVGGYYQYKKLLGISKAINKSKNRPFYILGGHGPSPEPEFYMRRSQANAVVIGEGEITIVELVDAIANKQSLSGIKGIAYLDGDKIVINERRPLIKNIDDISFPAYDLFPIDYYRLVRMPNASRTDFVMPVLSGRGCTFKCNFCYRMDTGFRPRSAESITDEIMFLKRKYGITYIAFSDELLMSSVQRTIEFCEYLIKKDLNIKWFCNGRLNYAKDEVLRLMKKAGCVFINYGIESMDDEVLKNMDKALTTEQVIKGVEATSKASISPGLNIIFGNIGESKKTLDKGVEFLLKYSDGSQMRTIRPVTPYPGSPLYYYAIEKGLLKDCEDFYENKHLNTDLLAINFTDMSDDDFYKCLHEANTKLLKNHFQKKLSEALTENTKLHLERDANFRGFRHY